ncbi:MAG: hypothetical protein GY868_00150 [Deltaproteobacteria bacterium]|nr:hypothetical protein [Deltaproteobacteria bacterium]
MKKMKVVIVVMMVCSGFVSAGFAADEIEACDVVECAAPVTIEDEMDFSASQSDESVNRLCLTLCFNGTLMVDMWCQDKFDTVGLCPLMDSAYFGTCYYFCNQEDGQI